MDIKKVREKLPRGAVNKIVDKTGLSRTLVSRALNGWTFNVSVVKEALNLIREMEEEMELIEKELKELTRK